MNKMNDGKKFIRHEYFKMFILDMEVNFFPRKKKLRFML